MIHISALRIVLRVNDRAKIEPWFGAVLRGGFGAVLWQLSCRVEGAECSDCPLVRTCAYGYTFETPIPPGATFMKLYTHAPHPFVFRSPLVDYVSPNRPVSLNLTLVGRAMDYLPYFIIALEELGRRGLGRDRVKFRIEGKWELRSGTWVDENTGVGSELGFVVDPADSGNTYSKSLNCVNIKLETPLWLKFRGEMAETFSFHAFVAAMIRRIETLGWWHCGADLRGRYTWLLDKSDQVRILQDATRKISMARYSARQHSDVPVGGLVGEVLLEGELSPFLGIVTAATYLGVGKKTAFGLGQIQAIWKDAASS